MSATPQTKSIYDYAVGDVILMNAGSGRRIHGKVIGHGRSKLKVVQLESDGKHGIGVHWNVKPGLNTPPKIQPEDLPEHILAAIDLEREQRASRENERHKTASQFLPGDKVRFVGKGGQIFVGTVLKRNKKSISVHTDDQPEGRWWNVDPSILEKIRPQKTDPPRPEKSTGMTEGERWRRAVPILMREVLETESVEGDQERAARRVAAKRAARTGNIDKLEEALGLKDVTE